MSKEVYGQEVTCIDFHFREPYLVAGYKRGTIVLWEFQKPSLLKAIPTGQQVAILCVKFLKRERLMIVSANALGDVSISEFTKAMFGYNVTNTQVYKNMYAFSINPLFPNELYPTKLDDLGLIAIADLNSVMVANLDADFTLLWDYKRSDASKYSLPYIDWGRGVLPDDSENSNLILAIAWDKVVQLIEIKEPFAKDEGYGFSGYYVSENEILALYWVSESFILLVNSQREVKIVYTGNFLPGKYPESTLTSVKGHSDKRNEELEKPYKMLDTLNPQVAKVGKEQSTMRNTYHQVTARSGRQVLCLIKPGIFETKLYIWNEFLEEQSNRNQWINALSVSIEVYSGALKGFAGIPERKDLREAALNGYMKDFLYNSLMQILDTDKSSTSPTSHDSRQKQIQVTIEYCIIISAFDLLFKTLFELFVENSLESLFFQALEPFVLAGKFASTIIPPSVFKQFVDYYVSQSKIKALEQALVMLNLENQDLNYISDICTTHHLFSALIYVKTIENKELLFVDPLIYMISEMKRRPKENYQSKIDMIFTKPKVFESTPAYVGYKIMWYIDLCFKGIKFPQREQATVQIDYKIWPRVIYGIINWLILEQSGEANLKEILRIDFVCVLNVLKGLFENEDTRNFLIDPEKFKSKESYGYHYSVVLEKLKANIEAIASQDQRVPLAFHSFLARVGSFEGINISPEWCLATTKLLSQTNQDINGEQIDTKKHEELILGLIKNTKGLKREIAEELISMLSPTPYVETVIYLRETIEDYTKCFDGFLNAKDTHTSMKIFSWLQRISEVLSENNEDYKQLKETIYERLERLVLITGLFFVAFTGYEQDC
uniref:Vps8 n=1 Tax=Castula fusca TaxID=1454043 RepID=A0A2P1JI20_9CILI|nr:Vps8 [Castula fusca]